MSAPIDRRTVDLGPDLPRVDVEPLGLPPTPKPEKCWLCLGRGTTGRGSHEYGWEQCPCCNGAGTIGGGQ